MKSPIRWFGGKGQMTAKLLPYIPEHVTYVEPFGGAASLLFAKRPSTVEVYNDLHGGLVRFFRVLRDRETFDALHRRCAMTPYSREEYKDCRARIDEPADDVTFAWRFLVVARMSFSGQFGASWGSAVTASTRGMASTCSAWLGAIERLPQIHARLMRVQIEQADFRVIFERYDTPETLFYSDPPYVHGTRSAGKYEHELTDADHAELVEILAGLKGAALVSGYANPCYAPLTDAGYSRMDHETACYAAGRTSATGIQGEGSALRMQPRTETVWFRDTETHRAGHGTLFAKQ